MQKKSLLGVSFICLKAVGFGKGGCQKSLLGGVHRKSTNTCIDKYYQQLYLLPALLKIHVFPKRNLFVFPFESIFCHFPCPYQGMEAFNLNVWKSQLLLLGPPYR